jgi:hydrogenase expression/formation protein HypE
VAAALNEIAAAASRAIGLVESTIPVCDDVVGVCEVLGFDPLYVACEGRPLAFVPAAQAAEALVLLRQHRHGHGAAIVGEVQDGPAGQVTIRTRLGGTRLIELLAGEQLPWIC